MVHLHLWRGVEAQLLAVVLVVDVVSDSYKLAVVVRTRQNDDGDRNQLGRGNQVNCGWVGREDELVDSNGNRAHQKRVEFLVVFERCGRTNVCEFPFEVCVSKRYWDIRKPKPLRTQLMNQE
jgi:hypothetical protein